MYYYCDANGTVQGPYTFAQIGEWVADGSLPGATTYVQHTEAPQGEEWVSYDAACAGVGTAVGTAAAASFYDDAQAVAEQAAYPEADSEAVPGEAAEEWGYGGTVGTAGTAETTGLSETPVQPHQWDESQWHYLDDAGAVQGPYNTETIGEWFDAGALGLERYVSIDGADWVKLAESTPFIALWSYKLEGRGGGDGGGGGGGGAAMARDDSCAHFEDEVGASAAVDAWEAPTTVGAMASSIPTLTTTGGRRKSILLVAKRCHQRRSSLAVAPKPVETQSELAKNLMSQRSMLRKTVTAAGRPAPLPGGRGGTRGRGGQRVHARQKSTHMSHLLKGLEVRRTIITRGKKRRSSFVKSSLPSSFKMADGSALPEAQASAARNAHHRRHVSEFSEDDEDSDDDWLSD